MKFYENLASQASIDIPKKLWMQYKRLYKYNGLNLFDEEFHKCLDGITTQIQFENILLTDYSNEKNITLLVITQH